MEKIRQITPANLKKSGKTFDDPKPCCSYSSFKVTSENICRLMILNVMETIINDFRKLRKRSLAACFPTALQRGGSRKFRKRGSSPPLPAPNENCNYNNTQRTDERVGVVRKCFENIRKKRGRGTLGPSPKSAYAS